MGERQGRRALLGRLAALGWFMQNGEVAATLSVAILLEEPGLRDALLRRLRQLTCANLGAVASFQGEVVHDKFGRPDLEGWDDRGRPLVVVEAKFGARLEAAQLQAYMTHQTAGLDGSARGALVVLVPSYRRSEAEAVLRIVGSEGDEPAAPVSTAVLTWDELLGLWDEAVQNVSADDRDTVMCDLRQLRGLCKTMVGLDIVPLGLVATGGGAWQDRESDLKRLVDEASAKFPYSSRRLPLGTERWPGFDYYRRYLPSGRPGAGQCSLGRGRRAPGESGPGCATTETRRTFKPSPNESWRHGSRTKHVATAGTSGCPCASIGRPQRSHHHRRAHRTNRSNPRRSGGARVAVGSTSLSSPERSRCYLDSRYGPTIPRE